MSFTCRACGRQRSGASSRDDLDVCEECWPTDMGRVARLLVRFEHYAHPVADRDIVALADILNETQHGGDGSITDSRRARLYRLLDMARAFHQALEAAIPRGHQKEW